MKGGGEGRGTKTYRYVLVSPPQRVFDFPTRGGKGFESLCERIFVPVTFRFCSFKTLVITTSRNNTSTSSSPHHTVKRLKNASHHHITIVTPYILVSTPHTFMIYTCLKWCDGKKVGCCN